MTLIDLHAEAMKEGPEVRIASLTGSLPEGRTFSASGGFAVDPLLETADLKLRLIRPVDPIRETELTAILRKGVVELSAPKIDTEAGLASLRATVPLAALAQIPELTEALAALSVTPAPGDVSVGLEAPSIDSQSLLAALGAEPRSERVQAGILAVLKFDPAAPAAGRGQVRVQGLTLETEEGRVSAEGPVVARLEGGRLELLPVRLQIQSAEIGATAIDLKGAADLDPAWKPLEDPPESLVRSLSAEAGGTLDAALLNPFLEGGIAAGALSFSASASGPLDRLDATFTASGPEASFWWPAAAARIEKPALLGSWSGEGWNVTGEAELNGGSVSFSARPSAEEALVSLNLADVPYRLDYGLTTRMGGVLALHIPLPLTEEGRMRLEGTIEIERGVLVRDINLDREVFTLLLAPEETPGTEATALSRIDLDLTVTTEDGIRVRNNVADLRARWTRLEVGGTAEVPEIRGRVDIDPGGLAYIYGQTARIDRGSLIFTGNPQTDPLIDLATTSSLDDPTIAQLRGGPLAVFGEVGEEEDDDKKREESGAEGPEISDILSAGLTRYYGARVVSRLGEAIGLSRLSVRPVLDFRETDPSARLRIGGDLSRNASLAISVDLRNPESRTAFLDLHGFRGLPGLNVEAFTTDSGGEGASLQQVLDFGGSREVEEKGERLRRLRLAVPEGISRRALRRAIRLRRKEPVPEEAPFEVEVDLDEALRRRGYPGAVVTADAVPVADRPGWVDLNVTVRELGPRVKFVLEGDRPPRALRSEILTAYRTDFYEERSIAEMKEAAIRAFRSEGHPNPEVEIEVLRERPKDPASPRTVVIRSVAGPRLKLEKLEIAGPAADAAYLAAGGFPGKLSRAELAAAIPAADRRLLDALRSLGYPEARITGREAAASRLVVQVEPGPRQVFGTVEITGILGEERERLAPLVPIRSGDGFREDLVSRGQLQIEGSLRSRGYADASVRAVVLPPTDPPLALGVRYEVEPGPQVRLAKVEFEGERWTRPAQLARLAGLKPGKALDLGAVPEAQSRLYRSGAFSSVFAEVDRPREDEALVTFSVAEKQRFHLGYGIRYESGVGTAAVVDAIDTSFLRRGLTLGFRALYEPDDKSGRLYLRTGDLFGTGISVETYSFLRRLINREEEEDLGPLQEDTLESALQLARPFGRRTTGRLYFRYRMSHILQLEPPLFGPTVDLEIRQPYMGTQVLYDSRNDKIDPKTGMFRSVDLSGSGPFLGSDTSYARLFGQLHLYRTFRIAGWPIVWAQAVRPGVGRAFGGESLISEDRFFIGGEYSVRGYETETLRAAGRPQEETMLVLNEELRFPLPFDLTGLAFFDAGQVWEGLGEFDGDLAKSLGLGLRAKTPVGLLRFDLAFPLDRRPEDEAYKLYFGFGNAF
ncbi:MAG TPA: translocation/assembly module TamB domain-containing protein [Thermoanaerobaculia bacterium]|nr:translocation/assembly module TamB domain-containing protein [Thermoanaerobaculia bacterium]